MKAPRNLNLTDMNRGDNRDKDIYNDYTLKIDIQ